MTEKHVQWLTYYFNIEYMFHIALEQLHHIDNNPEIDLVNEIIIIFNISNLIYRMIQY
jgi:hypothetical protein